MATVKPMTDAQIEAVWSGQRAQAARDIRATWALFDADGERYGRGYHTSERAAENDLYGRPDGTYVAPACLCLGYVREAYDCTDCRVIEEYGYDL